MPRRSPQRPRRGPQRPAAVTRAERAAWALQNPLRASQGWYLDGQGYVARMERVGGKRRYVREHRSVMEEHLGRKLRKGENVHHRNGNRAMNNLDNLELWVTAQPAGQRPEDLVQWAIEILEIYGRPPI